MFGLTKFFINKIEVYKRVTLEKSLNDVTKSKNRFICGKYSPKSFDMEYSEIEYKSRKYIIFAWQFLWRGNFENFVKNLSYNDLNIN